MINRWAVDGGWPSAVHRHRKKMALISLEGMRFHAFHGVYEAERKIGTSYLVDVYVQTGVGKAVESDSLEKTINYETIYQICKLEMSTPHNLIETVLAGIIERMKHQFEGMEALRVRVRKLNPPLGGQVESAAVEASAEFSNECPRCKRKFISYTGSDCWEKFPNLHPATREMLNRQFGPRCLCDDCLTFYAG
jgi:dihydroneopterin aldolase